MEDMNMEEKDAINEVVDSTKVEDEVYCGYAKQSSKKRRYSELVDWIKSFLLAAFIAVLIMQVIVPTVVKERSMEPNFYGGDYLIVSKISYKIGSPKRGDVVVFKSTIPNNESGKGDERKLLIKRVIGIPGDKIDIKEGKVYINGTLANEPYIAEGGTPGDMEGYVVPTGDYFVMGDHRTVSLDSRTQVVGPVNKHELVGKAVFKILPLNKFGFIKRLDPLGE